MLIEKCSNSAGVLRTSCASWDGNGAYNQLELRITAALWVPLQSHPLKQAPDPGSGHQVNTAEKKRNNKLLTGIQVKPASDKSNDYMKLFLDYRKYV